jgi:hypothetical protein
VHGHDRRGAEQSPELDDLPDRTARNRNDATAVVFALIIPIAASSAMMAAIVDAGVSPGTAIMSRPTEQTQVMASSLSMLMAPMRAASIIPRPRTRE